MEVQKHPLSDTVEESAVDVEKHITDGGKRRRHFRLLSPVGVVVLLAFVLTVFCAACLAVVTWYNVVQMSDLDDRIRKLESGLVECNGRGATDDDNDDGAYQWRDRMLKRDRLLFGRRQKRQANEKRKQKVKPNAEQKRDAKKKSLSAIHLNLDVREPTTDELQYFNGEHAYIYKAWKVAAWAQGEKDYHFDANAGTVKVQKKGLYFIYSQILYHNSAARSSYVVMVDKETFIKCMESVDAVMPDVQTSADSARYKTCYVGAAKVLDKGQTVWIKDLYSRFVTTDPTANFFGLVKMADL